MYKDMYNKTAKESQSMLEGISNNLTDPPKYNGSYSELSKQFNTLQKTSIEKISEVETYKV